MNYFPLFLIISLFFYSCSSTKDKEVSCHPKGDCSRFQRVHYDLPNYVKWELFASSTPQEASKEPYKEILGVDQSLSSELTRQQFEQVIYDKNKIINRDFIFSQTKDLEQKSCKQVQTKILAQNQDELFYEIQAEKCQSLVSFSDKVIIFGKIFEANRAFVLWQYRAEANQEVSKHLLESQNAIKNSYIENISGWEITGNFLGILFLGALNDAISHAGMR